jgi:hypothetical protein
MPIDAVVVNAPPLITLFRSGQEALLPRLSPRVVVPTLLLVAARSVALANVTGEVREWLDERHSLGRV